MVAYDNIAIFILATTLRNSIVNRIVPIASTWGADFPYLYFVMGTNDIDKQFLDRQCSPYRELGHRSLANAKQVPHRNELLEYRCPAPPASDLQVLFTANCTGTYFGLGPTCRCEESMRFFTTAPRFRRTEWFMFIDDDLFVRSAPFNSFLSGFDRVINQSITILRYATVRDLVLYARRKLLCVTTVGHFHDRVDSSVTLSCRTGQSVSGGFAWRCPLS